MCAAVSTGTVDRRNSHRFAGSHDRAVPLQPRTAHGFFMSQKRNPCPQGFGIDIVRGVGNIFTEKVVANPHTSANRVIGKVTRM